MTGDVAKPLHVLVAEALGFKSDYRQAHSPQSVCDCSGDDSAPFMSDEDEDHMKWLIWRTDPDCPHEECHEHGEWRDAPFYDQDWSATGPLIERFSIDVTCHIEPHFERPLSREWCARVWLPNDNPQETKKEHGPTPLVAVCRLLVSLYHDGKLEKMLR